MSSRKESVKHLCKQLVSRLESQKSIAFPARLRQIVQDEMHGLIGPYILTDEDLRERAIQKIGGSVEQLADSGATDSAAFKTAQSIIREQLCQDPLNGFYLQKPLRQIAQLLAGYFMRSSSIDEVYETDEDLEKMIIDYVRTFHPGHMH